MAITDTLSEDIILYDVPDANNQHWSPNTLRTRLALNFKRLPFKTEWLSYPDITPTLSKMGTPAIPNNAWCTHTVPAISSNRLPVPMMDSFPIAEYLDATYPHAPKLFPTMGARVLAAAVQTHALETVRPLAAPLVAAPIASRLDARGREYFTGKWASAVGMPLEEWREKAGDMDKFAAAVKEWDGWLEMEEGVFLMGKTPTYGDLVLVAFLRWLEVVEPAVFERAINVGEGRLKELYAAGKKWLVEDPAGTLKAGASTTDLQAVGGKVYGMSLQVFQTCRTLARKASRTILSS